MLLAFGVQIPSIFPIAQRFTAVWVNHDTRMPVHCAAKVTLGGIFYTSQLSLPSQARSEKKGTNHIMPKLHILNIPQPLCRRNQCENLKHDIIHHLPRPYIPGDKRRYHRRRQLDVANRLHDTRGYEEDHVDCDSEDQAVPGKTCVVEVEEGDADAEDGKEDC